MLDVNFVNKSVQIPCSSLAQTIFCNCWHLKSFWVHSRHSVPSQSHFILILMFLNTTSDLLVNRAPGAGFFKTTLRNMSFSPVKPIKIFRLGLRKVVPSSILITLASIFIESEKNSKNFKKSKINLKQKQTLKVLKGSAKWWEIIAINKLGQETHDSVVSFWVISKFNNKAPSNDTEYF